jgi:hypothetical protein
MGTYAIASPNIDRASGINVLPGRPGTLLLLHTPQSQRTPVCRALPILSSLQNGKEGSKRPPAVLQACWEENPCFYRGAADACLSINGSELVLSVPCCDARREAGGGGLENQGEAPCRS